MADILGLQVLAPWATENTLGTIQVKGGLTPSLVYFVTKLNKHEFRQAEGVAAYLEQFYLHSSIEVDRGLIYQSSSWVALAGGFVEEIVRDIVELAEIEASGEVPFWIKPLISVEFRLLRAFYDPNIPLLDNAPVDGAKLMLEPYHNLAWYVANGIVPSFE